MEGELLCIIYLFLESCTTQSSIVLEDVLCMAV